MVLAAPLSNLPLKNPVEYTDGQDLKFIRFIP